jgi:hypothetical protein
MSAVRNPILEECDRQNGGRVSQLTTVSERGALASRALEILAKAPEADEYADLLRRLELV